MNNKNNNGFLRNAFLYIIVIIAVVTGVQYFAGGSQSPSQQLSYTPVSYTHLDVYKRQRLCWRIPSLIS